MNDEIQYTDKFDILTYHLGTNSFVVMSPDCNNLTAMFYLHCKRLLCYPSYMY
jgi:hypothetical protein